MAANIPKFASFRPKPKPAPDPPQEPKSKSDCDAKVTSKKNIPRSKGQSPPPQNLPSRKDSSSSKPYFSDRRGDANVLRYGTLDRYDIPAYRRYGHGFILGLNPDQKIDRDASSSTAICIASARKRQQRLLTDKRLNRSTHRALRLVHSSHDTQSFNQDFIPITTARLPRDGSDDDDDEDIPKLDYRDIQGRPKSDEPLDPDTHYEPDINFAIDTEVTQQNSRLARRTKENPEIVQNWLDLIEHQEAMLKLERPSDELTASDKTHLAQVRISIYEEALKKTKAYSHVQTTLWKGLLTEATRAWDDTKLAGKWNEVLANHPHSTELWWLYLDFIQSSFRKFTFEDCRSAFVSCVSALQSSTEAITPETYLRLLVRLTSMTYDSGYQELALAIWQAVIEFHLMRPDVAEGTTPLSKFEEFWESEVPRIGETEAKGWKNSSDTANSQVPTQSALIPTDPTSNTFDDFHRCEVDTMTKLQHPGRMTDEQGEDDAFHTVLFSDIKAYLDIIPSGISEVLFAEAFLCFCGLPPLPRVASHQKEWWSDPFLPHPSGLNAQLSRAGAEDVAKSEKQDDVPIQSLQMTIERLFEQSFTLRSDRLETDFPRRLLKLVATTFPDHDVIGEYLLAFESRHFPSDAPKTAKRLLKKRPSSLRLYHGYGLVELRCGNTDKANQVFSMALSMQKDGTIFSTRESLQLYHSWVWEALHHGESSQALWRLALPSSKLTEETLPDTPPSRDALLQIRLILSERSERALLHEEYELAIMSTSLQALIVYFINDAKPEPAMVIHKSFSAWMASHKMSQSIFAELHAQYIADFLAYHVTHAAIVKPVLLRTTLEPLIADFPNNTILLSLYAANEARFSIDDRVRGIMQNRMRQGAQETSVAGWMFAICYERQRGEIAGSTSHSIRALYQRATTSAGQYCPAVWTAYLRFELTQLNQEEAKMVKRIRNDGRKDYRADRTTATKGRVKETFQNGLTHLPWCKEFIMLPFSPEFEGIFDDVEKWKLYRVMQEKEIRLYIDLDLDKVDLDFME